MQYDVPTPSAYFDALENDWRKETLMQVREMIFTSDPDITEDIQYKMLGYGGKEKPIFHLNAQKAFVGLYVGNIQKIDEDGTLLKGFDLGKGCIRIKKSNSIQQSDLQKFIEKAIKLWKSNADIGC